MQPIKVIRPNQYDNFIAELKRVNITEKIYLNKVRLLERDSKHPSLNFELMQSTKDLFPQTWSFRINRTKWRVLGYKIGSEFQVTRLTNHYDD
jgi:hypothetical protein